ncbi:MAG: DNA gyrase C-terminal beta-propeller domain-containing protein [Candidatus Peribacteraceae bacterium]|nr:DNA gyrase C-terminal beta-propeller domain-containing protein [Candidatus Peribacteraceae bacterium]
MENGLGKMTPVEEYRFQGRGGTGVKAAQLTPKTGDVVGGCVLKEGEDGDLLCISKQGQAIRMRLSDIPSRGRATQGVIVMRLNARDKVATMSVVMEDKESEEAVTQAAQEERKGEVVEIKKEERRVERAAAVVGAKAAPIATATATKVNAKAKVAVTFQKTKVAVAAKPKAAAKPAFVKTRVAEKAAKAKPKAAQAKGKKKGKK